MWEGHVRDIWNTYNEALATLVAACRRWADSSELNLLEAEVQGMEKILDCFATPRKIDAVRQSYGLPPLPLPRPWSES